MGRRLILGAFLCALTAVGACGVDLSAKAADGEPQSAVTVTLALGNGTHDVGGFLYRLACENGEAYEAYADVVEGVIPGWLLDDDNGDQHYFADLFIMLPAGECSVEAVPMRNPEDQSEECFPVEGAFDVFPGEPTEIVLMAQCLGYDQGSVDIVAGLNHPPYIDAFQYEPSKFIYECQTVSLEATATDPDGDAFEYLWQEIDTPPGAVYNLDFTAGTAAFYSETPGQYLLGIEVVDIYGTSGLLNFIIHVMDDPATDSCATTTDEVCCHLPDSPMYWMDNPEQCVSEGNVVEPNTNLCEMVCCYSPHAVGNIASRGWCDRRVAISYPVEECQTFCCMAQPPHFENYEYELLFGPECPEVDRLDGLYCTVDFVCCELGWLPRPFTLEECGGPPLHPDQCDPLQ